MKTINPTKSCFYCEHPVDLGIEDYVRIDTLQSVLKKSQRAYAHELCAAQADEEISHDRALDEYLSAQPSHMGPTYYEELFDGEY